LLQKYCIDAQLYLQHDLTIIQLAKAIGTNRLYLSQYFSSRGMNYNAYINDLRINHFIRLWREAVAAQRSFAIKQLAHESGYRSYNTFSDAFKRKMGLSVTAWIKAASEPGQS
jgi:AraC-like DNA-binding protein